MHLFVFFRKLFVGVALSLSAGLAAAAPVYEFTATSATGGVLGKIVYEESIFDGSAFQFVDNTFILSIDFFDPVSLLQFTAPGPAGNGTFFDSTGALPTVVGGSGLTGGTSFSDGVYIAADFFVQLGSNAYSDVEWSTVKANDVPEPGTLALLGLSLAGLGLTRRLRKR